MSKLCTEKSIFMVFCPSYSASENDIEYVFTFFPSYGRWDENILQLVQNRTDSLRESPDVLVTEIKNTSEQALIAIEYCGALPAGNQAWQRNGRCFSSESLEYHIFM